MPALNYKKQFASLVTDGPKIHTIRQYRRDGRNPKPGETLFQYTGMRTSSCKKLTEHRCHKVRDFLIWIPKSCGLPVIEIDGARLPVIHMNDFAVNDGFESMEALCEFFRTTYGGQDLFPFNGLLIQWAETDY